MIWHVDANACDAKLGERYDGTNKCLQILPSKTEHGLNRWTIDYFSVRNNLTHGRLEWC